MGNAEARKRRSSDHRSRARWISCLAVMALCAGSAWFCGPLAAGAQAEGGLVIRVERAGEEDTIRILAENGGRTPLTLIRPRPGLLEFYGGWGGWEVQVRGPGGSYAPTVFPGALIPFTDRDLVVLAPGESVGALVRLGRFELPSTTPGKAPKTLAETPGRYTVRVVYHPDQDRVLSATGGDMVPISPLPPTKSEELTLLVRV